MACKLTKKRVETIVTTMVLLLLAGVLRWMNYAHVFVDRFPFFSTIMLVATAAYTFLGCLLQTFGFKKASLILGIADFFITCTCLFYSVELVDFIIFFICMAIIIRRSSRTCDCMPKNPLA